MSADNWTMCPRCYRTNKAKAEELDKLASDSYGKVSVDKFDELRRQAESFREGLAHSSDFRETLREDYEIGIYNGEFFATYSGECGTCGFSFKFKHNEEVSSD